MLLAIISRRSALLCLSPPRRTTVHLDRASTMSSLTSPKTNELPYSSIPIFQTLEQLRTWRNRAFAEKKSVGFVPTMGALHEGHLSLVRRSLAENDHTVVSIFVNPTQFAPHEDLASYPRTLPHDLDALTALRSSTPPHRTTSAVFLPSVDVMYPSPPLSTSTSTSTPSRRPPHSRSHSEEGTFVSVLPLSTHLEGTSRPHFFRGVSTVVTKLFHAVQPSHAYFGQKDIQQALLLRRMVSDLLFAYPSPEGVHVVPTVRANEEEGGLALSSRNAYLSEGERKYAPALYRALKAGEKAWESGVTKDGTIRAALNLLQTESESARANEVEMRIDYIEMNDPWTFDPVQGSETKTSSGSDGGKEPFILSGAMWVGRTRLIDNVILGDSTKILY